MTKGILEASASGSVPIRGLVRFDENTPNDFSIDDARYLRRGVVETDITKFDTNIWPETFPVKINEESIRPLGSTIQMGHKSIGARSSNGQIVIPNVAAGSFEALVSNANDVNFKKSLQKLPQINTSTPTIFSAGYFIQAAYGSSNVVISNDLYDSYTEVNTGLASNIVGMIGNEIAIVAWASSGVARRSTDGGQTWSDISTLNSSSSYRGDVKGSTFLLVKSATIYTSNDNGETWANHGNINPSGGEYPFNDGVHFYTVAFTSGSKLVYKSVDGVNWNDGEILKGDLPISSPIYANCFNGIFIARANTNQTLWLSKDCITWHEYFRNDDFNVGSSKPVGIAPTEQGALIIFEYNLIDTLELLSYAGSINSTNINTEYADCDFVRIS